MRLPKILVLHGSEIKSDEDYAKDIINGMELAREMFGCSFTAKDGGDVLTGLKNKYVHCTGTPPRKYEFQVRYSDGSTYDFTTFFVFANTALSVRAFRYSLGTLGRLK